MRTGGEAGGQEAERRADKTKLKVAFRNFPNAPKIDYCRLVNVHGKSRKKHINTLYG
jgi:hypothetical protein